KLLTRTMRVVERNFRCRPGQPLKKPMTGKLREIFTALKNEFRHAKDKDLNQNVHVAFRPLLESKTVASLLYTKFRNSAIHGGNVEVDENKFFRLTTPYWEPLYSEYYPPFFFVKFPALFLIRVLENCLRTARSKILATGKLPPDVHYHVFGAGGDNIDF